MKKVVLILCIIMSFLMVSCAGGQGGVSGSTGLDSTGGGQGGVGNTDSTAKVQSVTFGDSYSITNDAFYEDFSQEEKDLYYKLWQPDTKIVVEIDIEPQELYKLQQAYEHYSSTRSSERSDTYRRCNLKITVDGSEYYFEEVGIRMRGNTSRRNFCDQNGKIFDYVHFRFKLNETFDGEEYQEGAWANDIYKEWTDSAARKARKNRTFATMEKFFYKWNKNYDQTYIREVYTNNMFSYYGVLAPHITLTKIMIKQNGVMENFGVAGLYETIDKEFIERNMPKELAGGDLYKCCYLSSPANLTEAKDYGVETYTQTFTYSLKTNDDRDDPDYNHNAHLKALINTLNTISVSSESFLTNLNKVLDTDHYTTFEAINYLVGNPDCIRHNSNNYYLYFTPDGRGYIIPYDYDRCLGITMDWNPDGKALANETPFETDGPNFKVNTPLYVKTILGSATNPCRIQYGQKLAAILEENWFTYDNFLTYYKAYYNNYKDDTLPSYNVTENVKNNIRVHLFTFSEDGNEKGDSNTENMRLSLYINAKRQAAQSALNY